jgi:GT2 family glycosyltransferase/glycosyltransferase involved in cell wall biosynthesis
VRRGEPSPIYLISVASDAELDVPSSESTLVDPALELLRASEREAAEMRAERDAAVSQAGAAVALRGELDYLRGVARNAEAELSRPSWRLFQTIRHRFLGAIGEDSGLARALRSALVVSSNVMRGRRWSEGLRRRIVLPRCDEPVASLIIPVHAQPALTEACLRSIVASTEGLPYEVIIVNDTADPRTSRVLGVVRNARLIVNETNLGFSRSVNRGAAEARGRYLVLCNNDIEVRPGWLRSLIDCAESAPDVGIVTPKFLYPAGRLNEAGGIVWRDGSAANFGRGDDPEHPIYNYRREVDYGSAAALLVRRDLWEDVGAFDERYAPAYYEDTDLCFAARERGLRVLYEPAAEVIHAEGSSHGTDMAAGAKRHQELNRPKFVGKWAQQLERQPPPPATPEEGRRARDRARGDHVLIVDHRIPSPDMDSGSVRMMYMLRALLDLGCSVTFLPGDLWRSEPYCRHLQSMGIEVLYGPIDVRREIAERGDRLRLAILCRATTAIKYLHLVRELAPQARLVYDTVDLHFLRELRRAELEGHRESVGPEAVREIELALIRACDVTVCISETERSRVLGEVSNARVEVLSNAHKTATNVPQAENRSGLVFLGGFEHRPNVDAAVYLVESIMPLIWRELDDLHLKIVGPHTPDEVRALASERVEVTGWVEEIEPVLDKARAMVAPLRYGAGIKGKITQSIALGLPVVTTTIGAEGIGAADGREMLIADEPAVFAERVVGLCRDDELWSRLSSEGRRLAQREFSVESVSDRMRALLDGSVAATQPR